MVVLSLSIYLLEFSAVLSLSFYLQGFMLELTFYKIFWPVFLFIFSAGLAFFRELPMLLFLFGLIYEFVLFRLCFFFAYDFLLSYTLWLAFC